VSARTFHNPYQDESEDRRETMSRLVGAGQLELNFDALSAVDLRTMLAAGLVEPVGATSDVRVVSYRLTPAGRILLGNQLGRQQGMNAER